MRLAVALLAVVAVLVAARLSTPTERRFVWPCAVAFALNWLWYLSAYLPAPYPPAWLVYGATGMVVRPSDLIATGDVIAAVWIITKAWERFWGIGLHALYLAQVIAQIALQADPTLYSDHVDDALSVLFYLQVACLLAGGADGVQDLGGRAVALWRRWTGRRARVPQTVARQEEYARLEESAIIRRIKRNGR